MIPHLEGVVLEQVGDTSLRLVATSGFYDDNEDRGRLSVVNDRDADAACIDRETALDTQVRAHASIIRKSVDHFQPSMVE